MFRSIVVPSSLGSGIPFGLLVLQSESAGTAIVRNVGNSTIERDVFNNTAVLVTNPRCHYYHFLRYGISLD
jgi:hypothetical protein